MSAEQLADFFERIGRRVIRSPSGYWHAVGYGMYLGFPYHLIRTLEPGEAQELLRKTPALGLKYSGPQNGIGRRGGLYVCRSNAYSLESLHKKMRAPVRRGLEACQVRRLEFDELRQQALILNQETLKRQGRDDPDFSRPDRWVRLCAAGTVVQAVKAWGALAEGELAAYAITFRIGDHLNIAYQFSSLAGMERKANHALAFELTRRALVEDGLREVSYGLESFVPNPGLHLFKTRIGYRLEPCLYRVQLHPIAQRVFLGRLGSSLRRGLRRFAGFGAATRMVEILDIAAQTRAVSRSGEG